MTSSFLYIASYVDERVEGAYDVKPSLAGNNKMACTIESLEAVNADVTVVSPLRLGPATSSTFVRGNLFADDEEGCEVVVPPQLQVPFLERPFVFLSATLLTLKLLLLRTFDGVICYNFVPEHVIPAIAARLVGSDIYLEYADGYFVHETYWILNWFESAVRLVEGPLLEGAFCVNTPLADSLQTDNTAIIRGAPSIGMPPDLPPPEFDDTERTVVMFAGQFDELRGIDTFLTVAEALVDQREDLAFWISGYGSDSSAVADEVEAIGSDRLTFFGTLPWEAYRKRVVSADVLVNFQDPEPAISQYTFPSKLLDFMSAGNVILSTAMSDLSEFDEEFVIPDEDEDIVDALRSIADDYERHAQRGKRAQKWVTKECSRSQIGARLAALTDTSVDPDRVT